MPVISLDGWSTFMSPGSNTPAGTIQVVLAIGTQEQITNLKQTKRFGGYRSFLREPQPHLPIASRAAFPLYRSLHGNTSQIPPMTTIPTDVITRKAQLAARLNSFIENLASELPDQVSAANPTGSALTNFPNMMAANVKQHNKTKIQPPPPSTGKNVRATADLLDELQRALTSASAMHRNTAATCGGDDGNNDCDKRFGVIINIESATNLPTQIIKLNKKHSKRRDINSHANTTETRGGRDSTINEIEPSSYVTFEATGPTINMVNTIDGPVYTTNVVLKNCNPQWNKRFDVFLPEELLFNVCVDLMAITINSNIYIFFFYSFINQNTKKFQLKIWRKIANDILQARLIPNPSDDAIIGCVSLDLTKLLDDQSAINGCYNILNSSEQITGQIKVII